MTVRGSGKKTDDMTEATAASSTSNQRQQAMLQPGDVDAEMLETWIRSDQLDPATLRNLRTTWLASLKRQDAAGLHRT